MAKRRSVSGKTSRKQRKVQRERSERAKQHGLPAKEPDKRARVSDREETTIPSMRKLKERAARAKAEAIEGELAGKEASTEATLRERIAKIPQAAQLAIVAGVVLLVIFIASQFRGSGTSTELSVAPAPSRVAPADELAAPLASVLDEAVALPSAQPAPLPSAEPEPLPGADSEPATAEASDATAPPVVAPPTAPPAPVVPPAPAVPKPAPAAPPKPVTPALPKPVAPPPPKPVAPPPPAPAPAAPPSPEDNPY